MDTPATPETSPMPKTRQERRFMASTMFKEDISNSRISETLGIPYSTIARWRRIEKTPKSTTIKKRETRGRGKLLTPGKTETEKNQTHKRPINRRQINEIILPSDKNKFNWWTVSELEKIANSVSYTQVSKNNANGRTNVEEKSRQRSAEEGKVSRKLIRSYLNQLEIRGTDATYEAITDNLREKAKEIARQAEGKKCITVEVQHTLSNKLGDIQETNEKDAKIHVFRALSKGLHEVYLTQSIAFRSDKSKIILEKLAEKYLFSSKASKKYIIVVTNVNYFKNFSNRKNLPANIKLIWGE